MMSILLNMTYFSDSVYTERYMGQPTAEDNLDAYNVSMSNGQN